MTFFGRAKWELKQKIKRRRFKELRVKFGEFTMIPEGSFIDNLLLAERQRDLPGCVVECGVWRGGMSAGMASVLGPERKYFLLDSFEGLPEARPIDGPAAIGWQKDTAAPGYHDNCAAGPEFAERAMKLAGAKSFILVKGWFAETLKSFVPPEPITILRLDGDWYESTMICLEKLFDHVAPGGLILIDDYFAWDGCSRAVHDFLSRRSAIERVQELGSVSFIEKRDPKNPAAPTRFFPLPSAN